MESFPEHINVLNFSTCKEQVYNNMLLSLFRKEIYDTLVTRKDETVYIDLDSFSRKYCCNNTKITNKILTEIIVEIHKLGWKTKLSFGDTGLFIYSTETPPINCW